VGKTNLLDAIYYLCFTKSYLSKSDQQNVQHGATGFRIEGQFELNGELQRAVCILRETGKKEFSLDGTLYEKFSRHIGRFPCVMVTPDDVQIIMGGSEERRRFMDTLICQLDPDYLQNLITYNKILLQRNRFLKTAGIDKNSDMALLDVYDEQLAKPGTEIFEKRTTFLNGLLPVIKKQYLEIAGKAEPVELFYNSELPGSKFLDLLKLHRDRDFALQRTSVGIHKDDIEIMLHNQPFKSSASQGQRKSLLFAMKLAEFETLKNEKGFAPILLLDDVFEKLDEGRMFNLLCRVCLQNHGQLFISDTHSERISSHFEKMGLSYQLIKPGESKPV
jgi:DNA replication and repair protein RecF